MAVVRFVVHNNNNNNKLKDHLQSGGDDGWITVVVDGWMGRYLELLSSELRRWFSLTTASELS